MDSVIAGIEAVEAVAAVLAVKAVQAVKTDQLGCNNSESLLADQPPLYLILSSISGQKRHRNDRGVVWSSSSWLCDTRESRDTGLHWKMLDL